MRSKLLAGVLLWTKFTHPPFVPFWGCNACAFQKLQPSLFHLTSTMSPRCFWATPFYPLGVHPTATTQLSVGSTKHVVNPVPPPCHWCFLSLSSPVLSCFGICCCHLTLWILPRLLVWKDLSSFPLSWWASKSRIHTNMDRTRLLKREILVFQPISKAFQMLSSSLLKDALVIAILFLMSAVPPSSLVTLAPRYVNLSTSFASLFLTLRLVLLLLFTFIYIYCISWHSASSQLLLSCLQALLSSAKPRSSSIEVKFKRIPVFSFLTVCCITQSIIIIEKRNKKPDMQQPCLTPVIKEKGAVTLYLVVLNRKALKHHTGR